MRISLASLKKELEELKQVIPQAEDPELIEARGILEQDYRLWLSRLLPNHFRSPSDFAPHHDQYWQIVWGMKKDVRPRPTIAVWPREGMKSTSAEATGPVLSALGRRSYGLYISGTQKKANEHLEVIRDDMLLKSNIADYYPELSRPEIRRVDAGMIARSFMSKWNQQELVTAGGLVLRSVGLDVSVRGTRRGNQRPDFEIFDDIEDEDDGIEVIEKKIQRIAKGILPAGAANLAVFFVQNLIHRDSVVSQVLDGRAGILGDAIICGGGPVPAIRNFSYRTESAGTSKKYFVSGTPSWPQGFGLDRAQEIVNGGHTALAAFETEYQHNVNIPRSGAVYPGWKPTHHVITYSEFMKVYGRFGAKIKPDGTLQLPPRGYVNSTQDWGTTTASRCVTLYDWKPAEGMPNTDCLFFVREVARPHFPNPLDDEIVSPIGMRRELFKLESSWLAPAGITPHLRQASHEQKGVRNEYLEQVDGLPLWMWIPIDTSQGPMGIAAIQTLLEVEADLPHQFRLYPEGHEREGKPLSGRTQFFLVVADGQGELYYDAAVGGLDVTPALDELGFNLTRYEFPRYHYPKNAQGAEANKPVKVEDNAMDALKAAVARSKGSLQAKTREEKIQELQHLILAERFRPENAANLTPEDSGVAAQASYFAYYEAKRQIDIVEERDNWAGLSVYEQAHRNPFGK